jgi:glycogen operon protein
VLGVFLNGEATATRTWRNERITDDSFLLLFNAHHEDAAFLLPAAAYGAAWTHELCTYDDTIEQDEGEFPARSELVVRRRSMKVLRRIA